MDTHTSNGITYGLALHPAPTGPPQQGLTCTCSCLSQCSRLSQDTRHTIYVVPPHSTLVSPFLTTNLPRTPPKERHLDLHRAEPPESMPRTQTATGSHYLLRRCRCGPTSPSLRGRPCQHPCLPVLISIPTALQTCTVRNSDVCLAHFPRTLV